MSERAQSRSWRKHLFSVRGSVVKEILPRVAITATAAIIVVVLHHYFRSMQIPDKPHALVGAALSLLLVFRTNASYDRFWEGRKLWGGIVNTSRNLGRGSILYLKADSALVRQLVMWGTTFPYALTRLLRREAPSLGPATDELPALDVAEVCAAQHPPLAVTVRMSRLIAEAEEKGLIDRFTRLHLESLVQLLVDNMGACERILNTPLPLAYAVHLRRALIIFCLSLPFALIEGFGVWTIPVSMLVSYIFFGIEEIGVEIEDPFGTDPNDLPLEQFCANIERNLRGLL